jgi:hypothetical protein
MLTPEIPCPQPKDHPGPVEPGAHPTRQPGTQPDPHLDNNTNNHTEDQHPRAEKPTRHPRE